MASPWVNLLSNEPGGGFNAAMKANNMLANENVLRQINQIKKQYLPTTMQAEAASKLAYANLMAPQFLAKIMGNDSALANMSDEQKQAALDVVRRAGMGQGSGANAFNQMQQGQGNGIFSGIGQPSTNSFSGHLKNAFRELLGQTPPHRAQQNAMNSMSQGYDNSSNPGVSAEGPGPIDSGSPFVGRQGYKASVAATKRPKGGVTLEGEQWYDKNDNPVYGNDDTYEEKTGRYKGVIEEGKEAGKIRAKQREELDDQFQQAIQAEVPMEHLNEIVNNPMFRKLRRDGLFQKLQLDAKEITGTPEEKQLIGDFQTTALKALSESIMGWKGRILDKEVGISNSMKVGPKDSIDAMLGKMPSIETFNEMTKQRARIASQIMRDQHISKGDALEAADRQVNGKEIRERIEKKLNTKSSSKMKRPDFGNMSDEELRAYIGE